MNTQSSLTVLAFDPGGTTGWSAYKATKLLTPDGHPEFLDPLWVCGQLGPGKHHAKLEHLIEHMRTDNFHLVTESFEFRQGRQRANVNLMSKEYIGVMERWCQQEGIKLHSQTAALGKGFVTDKKIKAMDLWVPGKKHAMDARRHLIFYLVNRLQMTHLIESWKSL